MRYSVLITLALVPSLHAQEWERDQLPLRFAQVSEPVRVRLATDWRQFVGKGREWGYCVTRYDLGVTKDGDTVYVVSEIRRADGRAVTRTHVDFECADATGRSQPTIHAHLTGDCTPSRADAHDALRGMPPFAMLVCGPGITASYDPRLYLRAAITGQTQTVGVSQPR